MAALFDLQPRLVPPRAGLVIVDVGAYVGDTPVRYVQMYPQAVIHALEPAPDTFAQLEKFTAPLPQVRRHRVAVASTTGEATLHLTGYDPAHSLLPRPTEGKRYHAAAAANVGMIQVPTITLDDFATQQRLDRIDVLKLDVQGGEVEALRGAQSLLADYRIGVIFTEVIFVPHYQGGALMHEVWSFLAARGYTLYDIALEAHGKDGQLRYGDAIFLSPQVRREALESGGQAEP